MESGDNLLSYFEWFLVTVVIEDDSSLKCQLRPFKALQILCNFI